MVDSVSVFDIWQKVKQMTTEIGIYNVTKGVVKEQPAEAAPAYDQLLWAKALAEEQRWDKGADWSLVPHHMRGAVKRYVEHGLSGGSFLDALVRNDLYGAVLHADSTNSANISRIVNFFYLHSPAGCWGTPALVDEWMRNCGLERRLEE